MLDDPGNSLLAAQIAIERIPGKSRHVRKDDGQAGGDQKRLCG